MQVDRRHHGKTHPAVRGGLAAAGASTQPNPTAARTSCLGGHGAASTESDGELHAEDDREGRQDRQRTAARIWAGRVEPSSMPPLVTEEKFAATDGSIWADSAGVSKVGTGPHPPASFARLPCYDHADVVQSPTEYLPARLSERRRRLIACSATPRPPRKHIRAPPGVPRHPLGDAISMLHCYTATSSPE